MSKVIRKIVLHQYYIRFCVDIQGVFIFDKIQFYQNYLVIFVAK